MLNSLKKISKTSSRQVERANVGPYCDLSQLMALRWSVKNLSLPKAKSVSRPQTGQHQSRFRGRGMEFAEVRVYQPGDDIRSIDWKVTARRQTPHTKIFNEERERPLLIVCDQSQSQFFGSRQTFKSVRAAETAALFAWTALEHNDRVGGIVFSERGHREVKPARNRKSIMKMLSYISDFNNSLSITPPSEKDKFTFNDALNETIRLAKPGTMIIIISDFLHMGNATEKQLSRLSKHNELVMIRTFDPIEEELPPPGFYPVSDGHETLMINSKSAAARKNYQDWSDKHKETLKSLAQKFKAAYIHVSTHKDTAESLQRVLLTLKAS